MEAVQTEGLTFEKVWAALMETRQHLEEAKQMQKETDRQMKETGRQMKETDRRIGELGNRFGELAEHLVAPNIIKKFNKKGFKLSRMFPRGLSIYDPENGDAVTEIDILMDNHDIAIAVEIKAKATNKAVNKHKERMAILRRWAAKEYQRGSFLGMIHTKKLFGAIAGAIMSDEVKAYAQKAGFFTIVQSGDTVKIDIPDGFTPREW